MNALNIAEYTASLGMQAKVKWPQR